MSAPTPPSLGFDYALLCAVPRVDRNERMNVGVLLYCKAADYLGVAVHVDVDRLRALDRDLDTELVVAALDGIRLVCAGDPTAGPVAAGPARSRFGWLTAPRSTVVQTSPVHGGLTADPVAELDRLMDRLVR